MLWCMKPAVTYSTDLDILHIVQEQNFTLQKLIWYVAQQYNTFGSQLVY